MGERGETSGVVFEFECDAMKGSELPVGLSQSQQLLYLSLRNLYAQCKTGLISREDGVAEKKKLVAEYFKREKVEAFRKRCAKQTVRLWRSIEQAANEYAKTKSPEAAERMYRTIYGMPEVVS